MNFTSNEIETLSLALEVGGKVAGAVIVYLGAWWIAGRNLLGYTTFKFGFRGLHSK